MIGLPGLADDLSAHELCPSCGARALPWGIDTVNAERRVYRCSRPTCARTWSVDGRQLDLLADPDEAPALRLED